MNKIALALIVKGTDQEAEFLDQCLKNISPYVDGIFVTSTYKDKPNQNVDKVATQYGAEVSSFQWTDDFSEARNFNFSQVPSEYDYIMWCDADDVWRGLENLKEIIEENKDVDAFAFNYLYAFDKYNNPTVVHKKTQIVRNDGSVSWVGSLHEDFKENRSLNAKFVDSIERMHMTTDDHVLSAQIRNIEISSKEAKSNPNDPRVFFNLGNSYFGVGEFKKAKKSYEKFLKSSQSNEEKYIVYQRLASTEQALGYRNKAEEYLKTAIGTFPSRQEAYFNIGYLYFDMGRYDDAEYMILYALPMKTQYHSMIVYNPRDYDYTPMMALAKVYLNKSRPDYALPLLEGCLKIYPKDENVKTLVEAMRVEKERLKKVIEVAQHIDTLGDNKEKIMYEINKLSSELQSHPAICRIRNKYFVKEESSGKDIAYYCGQTIHEWNPEMAKTKGIGGSEEAVINLSKEWVKQGYNVTVFNSCGIEPMFCDGVTYKPFWHYNPRDKYDHLILWRNPRLAESEINATNIYVDLHDVISEGEFTKKRLEKIKRIFVKTKAHRVLFPNISDDKFAIIPNGQDFELFDQKTLNTERHTMVPFPIEKNPYLLVNTSSPDRSMDVLPKLFKRVKERVPEARLKWCYGWEIFDNANRENKAMMEWKEKIVKDMREAGVEDLGRLSQEECAKLYLEGRVLAYPSEFYEIDCISVKKAQACGCIPVTTDFAAFNESVKYGVKIHSEKTKDNWARPYQLSFGLEDEKAQKEWVEAVIKILKSDPNKELEKDQIMKDWAKQFNWTRIASMWEGNLDEPTILKRSLQTNE